MFYSIRGSLLNVSGRSVSNLLRKCRSRIHSLDYRALNGAAVAEDQSAADAENCDNAHEGPSSLLEEIGCLRSTHKSILRLETSCEASTLRLLKQYNAYEKHTDEYDDDSKDYHFVSCFLLLIFTYFLGQFRSWYRLLPSQGTEFGLQSNNFFLDISNLIAKKLLKPAHICAV